jgi:hypothetical protein
MKFLALGIRRSAERHSLLQAGQEPLSRSSAGVVGRISPWLGLAPVVRREEGHQHRDIFRNPRRPLRELDLAVAVYARKCQDTRHVVNPLPAHDHIAHRLGK